MEPTKIIAKFVGEGSEKIFEISGDVDSGKTGTVVIKSGGSETEEDLYIGGGGGSAVIQELSVTANGDYTPGEGVDGYAPVHVNVDQNLDIVADYNSAILALGGI